MMQAYVATATSRGTGLTCPHKTCGGKFIVNLELVVEMKSRHGLGIKTISCPYCSRVSLRPGEEPTELRDL